MDNFKYNDKTKDTITIANKGRTKIKEAQDILSKIDIPDDFTNSKKLKDSIDKLGMMNKLINGANNLLNAAINGVLAAEKDAFGGLKFGLGGYSYEELKNMSWHESEKILSECYLKSPYLGIIDIDEYNAIFEFEYVNKENPQARYVPQASAFLDNNDRIIAVCFVKERTDDEKAAGIEEEGMTVFVDTKTGKLLYEQPFKGHANDMTSIKEEKKFIIPDHKDGVHGEWNIYSYSIDYGEDGEDGEDIELQVNLESTIENINSDALDYDSYYNEITILNGEEAYVYDKDIILNENLSSEERVVKRAFTVPDEIHDYENNEYYTARGGITVEKGEMTVAYGGFNISDSEAYKNRDSEEIGNLYAQINNRTGEPNGYYKDNVKQESEGVNYLRKGNTSVTMNYGTEVKVYASEESKYNKDYIAENYQNEKTIKAKRKKTK